MIRKFQLLTLSTLYLLVLFAAVMSQAQTTSETTVPRLIRFAGVAHDLNGKPLTGVVGITFALYAEQTGGAALWMETQNLQADASGHYSVLLGSTKPDGLPAELFAWEQARWIGVQIAQQPEQPRALLVSAPYALKAGDAETLGGFPPSAFLRAVPEATSGGEPSVGSATQPVAGSNARTAGNAGPLVTLKAVKTTGGTANTIPMFTTASEIQNSIVTQTGTTAVNVAGNLSVATGNSFNIGSNTFAFGSYTNENAFLGFAGNTVSTGSGNTASGYQALFSNSTGYQNSASGYLALYSNTQGFKNTASGVFALRYNTTGTDNTASGYSALLSTNTGHDNTATGFQALSSNTTGAWNTASGDGALFSNTNGLYNTGDGGGALDYTTTGSFNTAVGYVSGITLDSSFMTGSENTFLGYEAVASTGTLNNATAIGSLAEVAASNALVLGSISGVNGATASTNVGIGTTTPAFTLDVEGTGVINAATSFNLGGNPFAFGSYANVNAFLGFAGNTTTTGIANTAVGYQSLNANTSGNYNQAFGIQALFSNNVGHSNSAYGLSAMYSNLGGNYNTAMGNRALQSNTTGSYNAALGYEACNNVVAGSDVTCIGEFSGPPSDVTGPATYIANVYGVSTTGTSNPLVCIDSTGKLGTENCASNGAAAQQEVISRQARQIEAQGKQIADLQQQLARLEALIEK